MRNVIGQQLDKNGAINKDQWGLYLKINVNLAAFAQASVWPRLFLVWYSECWYHLLSRNPFNYVVNFMLVNLWWSIDSEQQPHISRVHNVCQKLLFSLTLGPTDDNTTLGLA